jgi:DNA-binding winged helix-turn-helix (wHTH) protein
MSAKPDCSQNWAFGAFELEGRTAELRRNGVAIRLQEQPSQLLLFLLQHAGQIVTREDLRLQLWPADTFVDFDHALNTAVMKLREALGDSSENPLYIQTLPRKGYRFVAPAAMVPSTNGRSTLAATPAPSLRLPIMGSTANDDNVSDLAIADAATRSKIGVSESASGDLQATDKAIGLSEADFVETPVQSARDLSSELKWVSRVGLTKASFPAPRRRERFAWGVAALCIALLTWFGIAHWRNTQSAESRHLRLSLLPPPSTSFVPYNFAISPDGRRLAFVAAAQDGGTALWIRSLAAGAAQQLTGTEGAALPFWSPDSRQVGFFQASKLKSVDPSSGAVQILCDAPGGAGGAWNNRGTIIFAGSTSSGSISGISKVSASGGEPQLVIKGSESNASIFWPSALPDGDHSREL